MKFGIYIVILTLLLCVVFSSNAAVIDWNTIEVAYLFDSDFETTAVDSSQNGRDGQISGAKHVDGIFSQALEFDGIDDSVMSTGYFGVGGTEPRTTVFWFKGSDIRPHTYIRWGRNAGGEKYNIRANVTGQTCRLRVEVNGGYSIGDDNICDDNWHHLAVVFPEGSDSVMDHNLYVDGRLQNNEVLEKNMNTDGNTLEVDIGGKGTSREFTLGLVDEFAIFNVGLTVEQIDEIRNKGFSRILSVNPKGKLTTSWGIIKKY